MGRQPAPGNKTVFSVAYMVELLLGDLGIVYNNSAVSIQD